MSGPPRTCSGCDAKPVARKTLGFCYDCLPGGPYPPPPCRSCESTHDYFTAGLCSRCHQYAPQSPGACRDCHAWGVRRTHGWLCRACLGWRQQYPTVGACRSCGHQRHVGRGEVCRLCWRQASNAREATRRQRPYRPIDVIAANRDGQQLFFADMGRRRRPRPIPGSPPQPSRRRSQAKKRSLFDVPEDTWARRRGLPEPPKTRRSDALEDLVRDHAASHGWSPNTTKRTRLAVRVLASRQRMPDQAVRASEVLELAKLGLHAAPVLAVLGEAGLLEDDRVPAIVAWFERQVAGLPPTMANELRVWFEIQHRGSTVPPRSRPRAPVTIRLRTRYAMPVIDAWVAAGHTSLREISREDVVAALPSGGNPRALTGAALRSIFRTLEARKITFINPTVRIPTGSAQRRRPLPADLTDLRAALCSIEPAQAALAALLAFHGLRPEQLRQLQLNDVHDGRLRLERGMVLLAEPVRRRLAAWLEHRNQRWPNTANPHLFINFRSASRTEPVGRRWTNYTLGIPAQAIRVDRILDEVHATGGDVRRLCDLFGLSVSAATHYLEPLDGAALPH